MKMFPPERATGTQKKEWRQRPRRSPLNSKILSGQTGELEHTHLRVVNRLSMDECEPGAGAGDGDRPDEPAGDGAGAREFSGDDDNVAQTIKSFATEDAPLSIGIVFDLSGSMSSKFVRARKALSEFLRTCNPQDEFFVVGFNDRPAVIVDYTSDVEDVEARMVMLRPENRTALIDAMYLGVNKLKQAKYDRKALLVISDGGDNRSRYTQGELTRWCARARCRCIRSGSSTHVCADRGGAEWAGVAEERSRSHGGAAVQGVEYVQDLSDIAERISEELRNEYVLGYTPTDRRRDGAWRKLKVRLLPPPGLPPLTAHSREGYYAPSQ
jgi:Ca-activated chloride channel family protein